MSFADAVAYVMGGTIYAGRFACTVERDNGDGTVDVLPDDVRMRGAGLARVPSDTGLPNTGLLVLTGARCLVAFRNADPRHPFVAEWEYRPADATVRLDNGAAPVARYGDLVRGLFAPSQVVAGIAGGTQEIPNPSPPPATIPVPYPLTTPFTAAVAISVPIDGVIETGAAKVFA